MKIAFIWQGLYGEKRYGHWNDGLYAAMKLVEKHHEVSYVEPSADLEPYDLLLYWEAPCTAGGKDRENYERIRLTNKPKILLFAGGPIRPEWCRGFDMFLVESKLNEQEFEQLGFKWKRAFGVNTDIFKPEKQPKIFDGMHQGTCASWKRQSLFARALGNKGVVCGRFQEHDSIGFVTCREQGTLVLPELPYPAVSALLNASNCLVNTSDYWGGGQRATLEAMACGVPAIVMSDSPKNREYVEESGAGLVCEPDENLIRKAIEDVKKWTDEEKQKGVDYVRSKWTHHHYANSILEAINEVHASYTK